MTTETTTVDESADMNIGFTPSQNARAAALAELSKEAEEGADEPGQEAEADGEAEGDDGKPRRRELDAKELAKNSGDTDEAGSAAFKKLRRDRRKLESLRADVESGRRQVEQMQSHFKDRLDRADAFDALEAELKSSPAKVLRRYGVDLSAVNAQYFAEDDPRSQYKSLVDELASVKKQLADRDRQAEESRSAQEQERAVSSAVQRVVDYTDQVADEFESAAFFKDADPEDYAHIMREAVLVCAKANGGTVIGDEAVKLVDGYYKKRYDAIRSRIEKGSPRTSPGTVAPAKLDKAPKAIRPAATSPVGSKDPESYEERWKAALSEL